MLHGADYLARLMLCHFACFNNQSNKIRVYRAILLPCYSLNLPRVSPGWCKSVFFFLYGVISWRLQRSKCAATLQSYHCLTQYSFFFFLCPLSFSHWTLFTANSLCLCHYSRKSWHSVVLVEKGPFWQSWHKTRSTLTQTPSPVPSALILHYLRVCNVCNITPSLVKTLDPPHPPKKQCLHAKYFAFQLQHIWHDIPCSSQSSEQCWDKKQLKKKSHHYLNYIRGPPTHAACPRYGTNHSWVGTVATVWVINPTDTCAENQINKNNNQTCMFAVCVSQQR